MESNLRRGTDFPEEYLYCPRQGSKGIENTGEDQGEGGKQESAASCPGCSCQTVGGNLL